MSDDEARRTKRKRVPFSDPFDELFRQMKEMMEEEMKRFTSDLPPEFVREQKLPDGSTKREFGPFIYGRSIRIGPDGKAEVNEFGNVKSGKRGPEFMEEREPLVDVFENEKEVHVVAELPGIIEKEIKLHATTNKLTISVDAPPKKYYKEVTLSSTVKRCKPRTSYKNGVLEVVLKKD